MRNLILTAAAVVLMAGVAQAQEGVAEAVAEAASCRDVVTEPDMQAVADELAAGVTAEREGEIGLGLSMIAGLEGYSLSLLESAQLGREIVSPRVFYSAAWRVGGGAWAVSVASDTARAGCVVGLARQSLPGAAFEVFNVAVLHRAE